MKGLIVGAGITGCYTAARLQEKGVEVALLARGEKADRLERDGLTMRDGIVNQEKTVNLRIVREPVTEHFDVAMVCIQELHRPKIEQLLTELPGKPIIWYLGNTMTGYEQAGELLGRERVLGGFPGVGGTWEGDTLLFADRQSPKDKPFNNLVLGEAFPEGKEAALKVKKWLGSAGMKMEYFSPIMDWHICHVALILPLAGAFYIAKGDLEGLARDKTLLRQTMLAVRQAFGMVRRKGYKVLPRGLHMMRFIPAWIGARKIGSLLDSPFGRIALAGHANTAKAEMQSLASDLMALAKDDLGKDLQYILEGILR